ncbi:hypothetical protein OG874_25385 [Nocardia sp. NBC_00565]|uniref:MAB_1171c family putative transporter n=1 Tax=Nocardia sp. NBC_00565 TaxID=2975993 RepID=UPI002E81BC67|nr:MAB_1171c family putative transporter [Nocardia sp. NBC_00565]WUC00231.1 hypothetical protein OG874_25385 [Nocardia sp. NBC_00565]
MSSLIPAVLGWSLIGYLGVIVAGRLILVRDTFIDRSLNRGLLWSIAALLLFRCTPVMSITSLPNQLALGCVVMVTMNLYCIARFMDDSVIDWRRERRCALVTAAVTAVIVIAGMSARDLAPSVDLSLHGAGLVVLLAFAVPVAVNIVLFVLLGIREIRSDDLRFDAQVVGYLLITSTVFVLVNQTLSAAQLITGWPAWGPQLPHAEFDFVVCLTVNATLLAIPLVSALITVAGLDRDGRTCRRLRPLWRDLTAAVPEIVLPTDSRADPAARLFRMTVEIRDAMLHLGSYLPADAVGPTEAETNWETTGYAHRLVRAAQARQAGLLPAVTGSAPSLPVTAHDFDAELAHLVDLANVWPLAKAAVDRAPRATDRP